jgi:hypothetical protein
LNHVSKIDAGAHAAKLSAKLSAKQSTKINQIKKITKLSAKLSCARYREAIARARQDPVDNLTSKVLKQLKRQLSSEHYKALLIEVAQMDLLDRTDWVEEMRSKLNV